MEMNPRMYDYYEKFQNEGIILYFNGPVSQAVVEGIADLMRAKISTEEAGMQVTRAVFSILVEQMQNIVRYSVERQPQTTGDGGEIAFGQVIVGREKDGRIFVACGNKIESSEKEVISSRIQKVQSMTKDELKSYYKEQRRKGKTSKGAGLGIIVMARNASQPLSFNIVPVDESTSFFSMKVVA